MTASGSRETFQRAATIQEACSLVGWDNPKVIAEKVRQLQRGLPKEDEFLAACVWMGKSSIIHKLDQNQLPTSSRDAFQVPDFFAAFDVAGKRTPTLIEVKTTEKPEFPHFTASYHTRLLNYSNLLNLPLLIAWHITSLNLWCLFDIAQMKVKRTAFHIDFKSAMENNLLGLLLGDVMVVLNPGNKIVLRLKKEGDEVRDPEDKLKKIRGILEHPVMLTTTNEEIALDSPLAKLLQRLFYVIENDVQNTEDADYLTMTYCSTREERIFASQLLGVMAFGTSALGDDQPNWLQAIKRGRFALDYPTVRAALSEGVKRHAVHVVGQQSPNVVPEFIN